MPYYYVSATWEGWPTAGSFGEILEADSDEEARSCVKQHMAESRAAAVAQEYPEDDATYYLEHYGEEWHVVDCFLIRDFLKLCAQLPAKE